MNETLKIGSRGARVLQLQLKLSRLGHFAGSMDGIYGVQTAIAVREFQVASGLQADGSVGSITARALGLSAETPVPEAPSSPPPASAKPVVVAPTQELPAVVPALSDAPLLDRCLALSGQIETAKAPPGCFAAVAGNFDGQAVSFGALQWNFGTRTLQPILLDLFARFPERMSAVFGKDATLLSDLLGSKHENLMAYFINMQRTSDATRWRLWRSRFATLGATPECIAAEKAAAEPIFRNALKLCHAYGLQSERAVALFFDICVQNGTIGKFVRASIVSEFGKARNEVDKLVIVANCLAD